MDIVKAIVLGAVQGLTEFLPVSSTAHLKVVPALMGWSDPGAGFTSIVQLGTTFAVIVYFWRDLAQILVAWLKSFVDPETRKSIEAKQGWAIFVGTLPIGIFGVAFKDQIETTFRSLNIISSSLIGLGFLMLFAEKVGSQQRNIKDINNKSGLLFGIWQALALIPGMSRSGSTITGGLLAGFNRYAAARFSFLLATPAILLAALFNLKNHPDLYSESQLGAILISTLTAFIVGYMAIKFLMKFLQTHSMMIFVVYRIGLGALLYWLVHTHRLVA